MVPALMAGPLLLLALADLVVEWAAEAPEIVSEDPVILAAEMVGESDLDLRSQWSLQQL